MNLARDQLQVADDVWRQTPLVQYRWSPLQGNETQIQSREAHRRICYRGRIYDILDKLIRDLDCGHARGGVALEVGLRKR